MSHPLGDPTKTVISRTDNNPAQALDSIHFALAKQASYTHIVP